MQPPYSGSVIKVLLPKIGRKGVFDATELRLFVFATLTLHHQWDRFLIEFVEFTSKTCPLIPFAPPFSHPHLTNHISHFLPLTTNPYNIP